MLISIYLPTKNRLELLSKAINSVKKQTYSNWELIVIDDGSNDGTKTFLKELTYKDSRIRFFSNTTSLGGAASRNAAILMSRGNYITGLDDDDSFTADRLQKFLDTWVAYRRNGVCPAALYSEQNIYQHGLLIAKTNKTVTTSYDDLFTKNIIGNQIFAPRENFIDSGLFNPQLPAWQDIELFLRILKKFGVAYLVPYATYNFDESQRPDRISLKSEEKMREAFEIVNKLHSFGDQRKTQRLLLQLLGRYYRISPRLIDYKRLSKSGFWPLCFIKLLIKNVQTTSFYAHVSKIIKNIK